MQDLGFVFRGPVIAKAPFNRSSGSEDIHTYLLELVPPQSPLELLRAAATPSIGAQQGRPPDSRGSGPWWGQGPHT